ncbi:MAG: hypothetical protein ABGY95_09330 [Rubritalea sp.]|uniref:hypothetical protein n=1 Tax=Rubritalea sp. TaxID=2109375 RepID=UPI003242AA6A
MAQALWMRLREEKWDEYAVAEGSADRFPKILQDLAGRKRGRAMKASHDVWRMLCKGGVHSAAIVVVPYLVETLEISIGDVQIEICDTLKSCAVACSRVSEDWGMSLRGVLLSQEDTLKLFAKKSKDEAAIAYAGVLDAITMLSSV